ncbi:hypothetical protein I7I51_02837 [Histoplasma capsulatum]|uniref:Uncharacterized protein n=1 Tax=Ajellomyces capsulatus TaxID=5037 RepID=A0A8A1MRH0_AJECA|nr:hypothetical protein I7I51_02837 [Histoplasma capsulatum]
MSISALGSWEAYHSVLKNHHGIKPHPLVSAIRAETKWVNNRVPSRTSPPQKFHHGGKEAASVNPCDENTSLASKPLDGGLQVLDWKMNHSGLHGDEDIRIELKDGPVLEAHSDIRITRSTGNCQIGDNIVRTLESDIWPDGVTKMKFCSSTKCNPRAWRNALRQQREDARHQI